MCRGAVLIYLNLKVMTKATLHSFETGIVDYKLIDTCFESEQPIDSPGKQAVSAMC
jgi:hypothetical protein